MVGERERGGGRGHATDRAVILGDTVFDVAMGRAAGIVAFGVAWGYHPAEALAEAGAETVLADYGDLVPALARRLGW